MYLHDYRWSGGFTSQELSVLRKALAFASDDQAESLDEKEMGIAANMARVVGGVFAAKRAARDETRNNDDEHRHFVPRSPRSSAENR